MYSMYQGDPTLLDGFNSDFDSVTPHLEIEKNRILKDRMRWAIFTIPVPASGDTAPSVAQVIKDSEQATGDHLLPDIAVQEKVFSNFAGIIGLIFANADQGHTCLGPVLIDRAFQRTHVQTHASGLLLQYALDTQAQGGLGLRRVQWDHFKLNEASGRAALRLGFKWEGITRAVGPAKLGGTGVAAPDRAPRPTDRLGVAGSRDLVIYSIIYEDWENGGREHIKRLMDRS